ncbi:MAG TPA: response regulator [Xanthobacteraceae bacterium]|jgi:CheY-like chemotaxis protein|nr:response regulator [Xanthobacteraceae bacterium]
MVASLATPGDAGRRILVVEDELMIRMLLEDMLSDLGYTVAAEAGRIDEAMPLAHTAEVDAAILDLNLNGQSVLPVAEVLAGRGVPLIFATGYGERGLPETYRGRPTLQKPFEQQSLDRALNQVFTGPQG